MYAWIPPWYKFFHLAWVALALSNPAIADSWRLNTDASSINFFSIKVGQVGETHQFRQFRGEVKHGIASIIVEVDSVDSGFGIRDERMREFLFESGLYPTIEIHAEVGNLIKRAHAMVERHRLPATLTLHGISKRIELETALTKYGDTLRVTSAKPVIVNASEFGMTKGIEKLSELVGGIDIANAVPVYFDLIFRAE